MSGFHQIPLKMTLREIETYRDNCAWIIVNSLDDELPHTVSLDTTEVTVLLMFSATEEDECWRRDLQVYVLR
jgi:hypothetical protein